MAPAQVFLCARIKSEIRTWAFAAARPLAFFNTAAFTTPAATAYGNERRGAIEGPCKFNWNASLAKSFRFGPQERHHLGHSLGGSESFEHAELLGAFHHAGLVFIRTRNERGLDAHDGCDGQV